MIKFWLLLLMITPSKTFAYVPTIESLFRNGTNPDMSQNAAMITLKITPVNPLAEKGEQAQGQSVWVKLIYHLGGGGRIKLTQLTYPSSAITDTAADSKVFFSEMSPNSFDQSVEMSERGLFYSIMNSLVINDGAFITQFLKTRGINVALNYEILNKEKKQLLERHKAWLIKTKGGRQAEGEDSPLAPASGIEREKVNHIMALPMYASSGQIGLVRFEGEAAWNIKADAFEAWVGDSNRDIKQVTYKSSAGESEFVAKDYIKYNGTTPLPRLITFKNSKDLHFNIEPIGIRYFNESGQELVNRLKRYDKEVRAPRDSAIKPYFLF
jgi:hypothetical protein